MRPGFTLVELLVVIGIIVLLVGILLPVVRGVRQSAYAAASAQQISRLTAAIEAYNADYGAYPGPLSNDQIILQKDLPSVKGGTALTNVTMTENLTLGIVGGLKPSTTGTNPAEYDEQRILSRMGPMGLNPLSPKASHPYIEAAASELSLDGTMQEGPNKKNFKSNQGGPAAKDSAIPEFVDHFPDALPVLYLRARKGAPGVISTANRPAPYQYDLQQIAAYTLPTASGANGITTGIGGSGPHGLNKPGADKPMNDPTVKPPEAPWGNNGGVAPYTAITYFMNPQLTSAADAKNATGTPRQKDGYILISAGKDRIYGTPDDITNFGGIK